MEGYHQKQLEEKKRSEVFSFRTGGYAGQYFTGKRFANPQKIIDQLQSNIDKIFDDATEKVNRTKESAEAEIERLKKRLKKFV